MRGRIKLNFRSNGPNTLQIHSYLRIIMHVGEEEGSGLLVLAMLLV